MATGVWFLGQQAQTPTPDLASLLVAFVLVVVAVLVVPGIIARAAGGVSFPIPGLGAVVRLLRLLLVVVMIGLAALLLLQYVQDAMRDDEKLPVFIVDSKKTPKIAEHIRIAIGAGQPQLLYRVSEEQAGKNRKAACGDWPKRRPKGSKLSCDEYPFASARPADHRPHIMGVPLKEQRRQGGQLRGFYARHRLPVGGAFVVVVK